MTRQSKADHAQPGQSGSPLSALLCNKNNDLTSRCSENHTGMCESISARSGSKSLDFLGPEYYHESTRRTLLPHFDV
jgi:hypothetical protein